MTVKNGYVRLYYCKYNLLKVVLYCTNEEVTLTTAWGCIDFAGLKDDIINDTFLSEDEIKNWSSPEWTKYVDKVAKYILAITDFAENNLHFAFESYMNYGVDYKKVTVKLLDIEGLDGKWWINASDAVGDYNINAFAGFPPSYAQIDLYLRSLKLLRDLIGKVVSMASEYEDIEKTHSDVFTAEWCRRLLKRLTKKQKELFSDCVYKPEMCGDT